MATEKEAKRVISESSEVEKDGGEEEKEVEGAGMWSWGAGTDGQLGTGNLEDEYLPQSIALPSTFPISRVACGGAHSIALTGDGRVLSWGRGSKGQLGHEALVNCLKPKFVKSLESYIVSDVSAGWNHSGFVTGSGRLLMCGDGSFGQLGNGDHQSHSSPIEVLYFVSKHVEQIACGMRHSLVLVREHQENIVSGFGSTRHGQIGAPLYVTSRSRSISLPKEVQGFENHKIIDIFANGDQSAALSVDGQLYTWGRGFNGRLGSHSPQFFPSSLRFSQVSLGWNHALLLADGEAFMLGGKHHGMLSSSQLVKIQQQQSTCVEYSDESLLAPPLERVSCVGEEKVVHIAAGAEHSALVTEKGKIMTWGWGEHGQLGFGDTKDQSLPCTVNIGYKGCVDGSQVKVHCGSGYTLVVKSA